MEILLHKEEETLVVLVELYEREQNDEKRVALALVSTTYLVDFLLVDDGGVVVLAVLVHHDCSVYPHGETIEEITLFLCELFLSIGIAYRFGTVLAESQFLAADISQ